VAAKRGGVLTAKTGGRVVVLGKDRIRVSRRNHIRDKPHGLHQFLQHDRRDLAPLDIARDRDGGACDFITARAQRNASDGNRRAVQIGDPGARDLAALRRVDQVDREHRTAPRRRVQGTDARPRR
jgi:hypothetical protein